MYWWNHLLGSLSYHQSPAYSSCSFSCSSSSSCYSSLPSSSLSSLTSDIVHLMEAHCTIPKDEGENWKAHSLSFRTFNRPYSRNDKAVGSVMGEVMATSQRRRPHRHQLWADKVRQWRSEAKTWRLGSCDVVEHGYQGWWFAGNGISIQGRGWR